MYSKPLNFASFIDSTCLSPVATEQEIEALCVQALKYKQACVCVNPYRVPQCRDCLRGSEVKTATVIAFPSGAETVNTKLLLSQSALDLGAQELNVVVNQGAVKDNGYILVEREIEALVNLKARHSFILKIIIETASLNQQEIIRLTHIIGNAGADFIKTSTGYGARGVSLEDIQIIAAHKPGDLKIKASGGIRSLDFALQLIAAGADRIGTSSGEALCTEFELRSQHE